jgi:hypothetical protein
MILGYEWKYYKVWDDDDYPRPVFDRWLNKFYSRIRNKKKC